MSNKICPLPLKGCLPSKITTVKWVGPGKMYSAVFSASILSSINTKTKIQFYDTESSMSHEGFYDLHITKQIMQIQRMYLHMYNLI